MRYGQSGLQRLDLMDLYRGLLNIATRVREIVK